MSGTRIYKNWTGNIDIAAMKVLVFTVVKCKAVKFDIYHLLIVLVEIGSVILYDVRKPGK